MTSDMTDDAASELKDAPEEDQAAVETLEEEPETPSRGSRFTPAFGRKKLLAAVFILLAVFGGSGYIAFTRLTAPGEGRGSPEADQVSTRNLVEQDLAPFYIQLPVEARGQLATISFSVTWDRSSSIRFQNREVQIRDRIYYRMIELASEGKDIEDLSTAARLEAQSILEELLRPDVIGVAVKRIRIV